MATTNRGPRNPGRRLTPWGFPLIYVGWAYLWWLPVVTADTSVWSFPTVLFFLVGGASPLLAGVAMAYATGGTDRLRDLGRRLVDPRRIGRKWWAVILIFWPAFNLLMAGAALALGVTDRPLDIALENVTDPGAVGFVLLLSFVLPSVEEIGLRGYWLDELRERFGTTTAGLLNGAGWALWHAPFVLFPGYYANTSFQPALWWWLPSIVLVTLPLVWVYDGTGRSILAVVLFHGAMNATGEFLGNTELWPFAVLGQALVAVGLVAYWQWRGRSDRAARGVTGA
jgi:membrane protease YdiL (CAAX protease family)